MERQIAEKLHAYTRTYKGGGTTRARDLVDLLLIRQYEHVDPVQLQDAIKRVFDRRGTHPVPGHLPPPPRELTVGYRHEAQRVAVVEVLDDAHRLLSDWLNPALQAIRET